MSFLTYESTRPWAKAMKAAVLSKKMPPWFADPHFGGFRNAPQLNQADIDTIAAWVDSGAREGDAADKTEPVQWKDGWRIPPDIVVSMPEPHSVPAKGSGEIKEFFVPNPFKQDTWVTSIEIRPGDPSVVHHVIVQIPEQQSSGGKAFAWGTALQQAVLRSTDRRPDEPRRRGGGGYSGGEQSRNDEQFQSGVGTFTTMEAVYAPGSQPLDFRYHNSAKLIRAGKPIRIEVHYTPNGKETTDKPWSDSRWRKLRQNAGSS